MGIRAWSFGSVSAAENAHISVIEDRHGVGCVNKKYNLLITSTIMVFGADENGRGGCVREFLKLTGPDESRFLDLRLIQNHGVGSRIRPCADW